METTPTTTTKRWARRRYLVLLAAPVLLGVGFLALRARAADAGFGFGPGWGHGGSPEQHKAFMMRRLDRMLDMVKADDSQRTAIKAIAERTFAETQSLHEQHGRIHDQIATALAADPVDRASVENLRTQLVKMMDQGSQAVSKGLLDAAQILTPAQRQTLAQFLREHHGRRRPF
jgi:Spy/CpxP family protein refolding chaperone